MEELNDAFQEAQDQRMEGLAKDVLDKKTVSAKFAEASNNLTNANLKISTATLNLETMKKKFPLAKSLIDSIKAKLNGE